MSVGNWLSPVQIVDSKVLGLDLSVADGFEGGETHFSLTMNSSLGAPTIVDGNYVCKCVLEAVGNWLLMRKVRNLHFPHHASSAL